MLPVNIYYSSIACFLLIIVTILPQLSPSVLCWAYYVPPPAISRATNLPNEIYEWRGQKIRYQVAEPAFETNSIATQLAPTVILIHGLFVNSDHWRKTLKGLSEGGYRTYAIDLLGCGYSSKPPAASMDARIINGENFRFIDEEAVDFRLPGENGSHMSNKKSKYQRYQSIIRDVTLGTPKGMYIRILFVNL